MHRPFLSCLILLALAAAPASATLVLNAARPITERVTVQVITAAANNGTNVAPAFGTPAQQTAIFGGISGIWAQAGIDVQFKFRLANWNNDFALLGTTGKNNPRPDADLDTIFTNASTAGLLDPNPLVLNLIVVRIVPGFFQKDASSSNGIAFVDDNGLALWVGPTLVTFANGQDAVASVLAHEIGHNLGLDHIVSTQNLMDDGNAPIQGQRLTSAQIATAIASKYSVAIPEPGTALLLVFGFLAATATRTRRAA